MRNDGTEEPKHVAFIDDVIKGFLCLMVIRGVSGKYRYKGLKHVQYF